MTLLKQNSDIFADNNIAYDNATNFNIILYLDRDGVDFVINDVDNAIDVVEFCFYKNFVVMKITCSDKTNDWFYTELNIWNKFQISHKVNWAKEGF